MFSIVMARVDLVCNTFVEIWVNEIHFHALIRDDILLVLYNKNGQNTFSYEYEYLPIHSLFGECSEIFIGTIEKDIPQRKKGHRGSKK